LRIVVHREIPESPELRREWNALVLQMERPEVFYTWEWARAAETAYRAHLNPLLLLAYEGNALVGVVALAADNAQSQITFLASTTADYCDFLSAPHRRSEFVKAVLAELRKNNIRSLMLANLPEDSATAEALRAHAGRHGLHVFSRPAYLCARVELKSGEQRQELKVALAGKKKLRRYLREMERDGPVTFVHLQNREEIRDALPGFMEAHVARFFATGRVSSLATPERRLFVEELVSLFADSRVVTLSLLKIGDRAMGWNFGFQFHGSWFWYQPTFDSAQEANSPGHCLLSRIVIEACDMEGMEVVDLGLGAEGYKERFGNGTRQTLHVTVTKSSFRHLRTIARYRAANALKGSPRVESIVRRVLNPFSSIQRH
jgi:CelD/BcsL family acetyltransferase involved in cellulose biosynthesis